MRMRLRLVSWMLLVSFATPATAATLTHVDMRGALQLSSDAAVLGNILLPDATSVAWLKRHEGQQMEVETLGVDRYGRALVIARPQADTASLQQQMLRQGLAIAYFTAPMEHTAAWLQDEAQARQKKLGLWASADSILSPEMAAKRVQQCVMVEAVVHSTYRARDAYYVNLSDDWRQAVSIQIPRKYQRAMADVVQKIEQHLVADASGKRYRMDARKPLHVRVRGTVIHTRSPLVIVTRPEHLEITHAH